MEKLNHYSKAVFTKIGTSESKCKAKCRQKCLQWPLSLDIKMRIPKCGWTDFNQLHMTSNPEITRQSVQAPAQELDISSSIVQRFKQVISAWAAAYGFDCWWTQVNLGFWKWGWGGEHTGMGGGSGLEEEVSDGDQSSCKRSSLHLHYSQSGCHHIHLQSTPVDQAL